MDIKHKICFNADINNNIIFNNNSNNFINTNVEIEILLIEVKKF